MPSLSQIAVVGGGWDRYEGVSSSSVGVGRVRSAGGPDGDRLARLVQIVEESTDFVATTDLAGTLLYANTAFRERFTDPSAGDDCVGRSLFEFFTERSRDHFLGDVVPVLWKQGRWCGEIEGLTPDGDTVALWQSAIAHLGPDGRPAYFSGIAHDMTAINAAHAEVRVSAERFNALVGEGSDVILVVTADGRISYATPAIERILGYRVVDLINVVAFDLIHPDDLDEVLTRFITTVSGQVESTGSQCRVRHADGSWRWVELFGSNHLATPGINGLIINGRDITARHDANEELARAAELLASVMRAAATEAIIVTDCDAQIIAFSRGAEWLLGYTAEEVIGKVHPIAFHQPDEVTALAASLDMEPLDLYITEPRKGRSIVRDCTFVRKDRSTFHGSIIVSARYAPDGSLAGFLYLAADITKRAEREATLSRAAGHDALTGLPNRSSLQTALTGAATAETWDTPGRVLLFVDLDRFKQVNDTLGHAAGDAVLVQVAKRLNDTLRAEDLAVRFGGDEFVILLAPHVTIGEGTIIAERIVKAMATNFHIGDQTVSIGASIGLALSRNEQTPEQLLFTADTAAYQAKHAGRGRVEIGPT